jgi:hypothetical protein
MEVISHWNEFLLIMFTVFIPGSTQMECEPRELRKMSLLLS